MTKLIDIEGMSWDDYQRYYDENKEVLSKEKFWKLSSLVDVKESNDIHSIFLETKLDLNTLAKNGFEARDITKGKKIENWNPNLIEFNYTVTEDEYKVYDKIENNTMMPIVSEKFKNLIESLSIPNLQFLALDNIKDSNGEFLNNYYFMNVLEVLETDVIDLETSIFKYSNVRNEVILRIIEHSIRYNKINHSIFRIRLNKYSNSGIIISDEIRKLMIENNITGFSFERIRVSIN